MRLPFLVSVFLVYSTVFIAICSALQNITIQIAIVSGIITLVLLFASAISGRPIV